MNDQGRHHSPFDWHRHKKAEQALQRILDHSLAKNCWLRNLQSRLLRETSTRLFDWIDHVALAHTDKREQEFYDLGFILAEENEDNRILFHPGAQLAKIVLQRKKKSCTHIALKVDSISHFLLMHGLTCSIEGSPLAHFRKSITSTENDVSVLVVERRCSLGIEPGLIFPHLFGH